MDYFAFQWHITDACDQRCKHCYIFAEGHPQLVEMPFEHCPQVLDNIERMCRRIGRLPYLYITGGDPILHSHFWPLLEEVQRRGIAFCLMGNPFHLNDEVCHHLAALGCRKYQLSLDGLRATHDGFRKPGSFDRTLEAIAPIRRAGMDCAIMSTVSGTNINELPDLINIVVEHQADIFAIGRYCPTTQDKARPDGDWHIVQYKDSGTYFNLKDHLWTLYLYEQGLWTIPDGLADDTIYGGCNLAHCHFTISAEGHLMACRRMESRVGEVDEEMADVWQGSRTDRYREHERMEKCSRCELLRFCRGCPAVAYGYHGRWTAPDPQCWKVIEEPTI